MRQQTNGILILERNLRMRVIYRIALVLLVLATSGCKSETPKMNLEAAIRGEVTPEQWESFEDSLKFDLCLRYKISEMRRMVRGAPGPIALIDFYPVWQDGLEDCEKLCKIDHHQAEILREAVATKMAEVLGEVTASYLHTQRLYKKNRAKREWVDMWRSLAIVGVSEVENVLNKQK
jgi:hypothetical protein